MGHVAIAVTLLCHQKKAPAIEARVNGGIGWQVIIGVCRWVVARLVGIGRIDWDCGRTAYRSALELEGALPYVTSMFVKGHAAPAARAAANIHDGALGKIENDASLRGGRCPKRNVGVSFAHNGERRAGGHDMRNGSSEHFDQSAYV